MLEAATGKRPRFFAPARFAVLDALTETIMPRTDTPGARDTLVPKRIDGLMTSWASPKTQAGFTRILDEIEAAAPGFAKLDPAKQLEAASAYNTAKMRDPAFGKFKALVLARIWALTRTPLVLNQYNQAHDVPNLFISDGSAMASTATQNPSLTHMALSARAAHHAVEFLKAGKL